MRNLLLLYLLTIVINSISAQMPQKKPEEAVRFLADNVLAQTSRELINFKTGEIYEESDGLPIDGSIKVKSKRTDWHYENGVLNIAMLRVGDYLEEEKYVNYVIDNYKFLNKHFDYFRKQYKSPSVPKGSFHQLYKFKYLDNCGTMGAALIEMMNRQEIENKRWSEIIVRTADYIMNVEFRLEDGTLCREYPRENAVWADDLYMSVVFLSRFGYYSGQSEYFDFAIKQVKQITEYLRSQKNNLYHHAWFHNEKITNGAFWGRANGWVMMAQVELLNYLPEEHPERDNLLGILNDHISGLSRFQSQSGLWHQLLDKNDSFLESSCTAMFIYGIAKSVNEGWIDPAYSQVAWQGWEGLYSNITEDAQVKDICVGTHVEMNLPFYYNRPVSVNDTHGLAATLLAGAEIYKMGQNYSKKVNAKSF